MPLADPEGSRYRIGALLYFRDEAGRILLMQRRKRPNAGLWCAVGGKLEMASGESPYECAIREAFEETGVQLQPRDLALRSILAEKDYEQCGHWLMFIFQVLPPLKRLPEQIEEGQFSLFGMEELSKIAMPPLDRDILLDRILAPAQDHLHILRAESGAARDARRLVLEELIGEGE